MKLFKGNPDSPESIEVQSFQNVLNILNANWQVNGHSGINPISINISTFGGKENAEGTWYPIMGDFCGEPAILGYVNYWDADFMDFNTPSSNFLLKMIELFPKIDDLNKAFDSISERLGIDKEVVKVWRSRSIGDMTINQLHAICKMFDLKSSDILKF